MEHIPMISRDGLIELDHGIMGPGKEMDCILGILPTFIPGASPLRIRLQQ